jgi:hypothetical protein
MPSDFTKKARNPATCQDGVLDWSAVGFERFNGHAISRVLHRGS